MKGRIVFIDLLRGWAALVMIEVHVFNAFLTPAEKATTWFGFLTFVNGLVAPAFLFVAGLVFAIVLEARSEESEASQRTGRKQAGRILLIWSIGYALHIPVFSFSALLELPSEAWLTFYQSDILHCIAAGLLILAVLGTLLPRGRTMAWWLAGLAVLVVIGGVFLEGNDAVAALHPAIRAYLDHRLSLFPLFPWLGFMLAGGALGAFYAHETRNGNEAGFGRFLGLVGVGLMILYLPELVGILPPWLASGKVSPFFFSLRLGLILLLLLTCRGWVVLRGTTNSFVLDAGRESLLIYAGHLLILYGTFLGGRSLVDLFGGSANALVCVLATAGLTALMIALARGWSALKNHSRVLSRRVAVASAGLAAVVFFLQ